MKKGNLTIFLAPEFIFWRCLMFNITGDKIDRWLNRRETKGSVQAVQGYQRGHSHRIKDWEEFRAFAQQYGDKTQVEMAQLWLGEMSERTMSRALARIGWTRKKRLMVTENEMVRFV